MRFVYRPRYEVSSRLLPADRLVLRAMSTFLSWHRAFGRVEPLMDNQIGSGMRVWSIYESACGYVQREAVKTSNTVVEHPSLRSNLRQC